MTTENPAEAVQPACGPAAPPDAQAAAQPSIYAQILSYMKQADCSIDDALAHFNIVKASAGRFARVKGLIQRQVDAEAYAHANPQPPDMRDERQNVGAQAQSERGGDVSIFIDDLREKARSDPAWARLYWDAIKTRQTEEEITPELQAKAAQAVAMALDVHVKGLPACCEGAVRAFTRRILKHVK